jgi:hypothetical protein
MDSDGLTGPHALERDGVLADEVISNELVVQDDEANQSHLRMMNVEFQTLLKDRTITLVEHGSSLLLC